MERADRFTDKSKFSGTPPSQIGDEERGQRKRDPDIEEPTKRSLRSDATKHRQPDADDDKDDEELDNAYETCPHHPYVASTTLRSMPIWAFHGDADDIVPLRATSEPIEAIRRAGGTPNLTVYPGVGHVSWVPAYDTPELWQWLFEQRREEPLP